MPTRDGRWWAVCWGSRDEASLTAFPLDAVPVMAIAAEVMRVEIPNDRAARITELPFTDEHRERLARIGAPALSEWARDGLPPPVTLQVEAPERNIGLIRGAVRCF